MNITILILAGIAGSIVGYLVFRLSQNRGFALIIPLLIIAAVAVLVPPPEKQNEATVASGNSNSGAPENKAEQVSGDQGAAG